MGGVVRRISVISFHFSCQAHLQGIFSIIGKAILLKVVKHQ